MNLPVSLQHLPTTLIKRPYLDIFINNKLLVSQSHANVSMSYPLLEPIPLCYDTRSTVHVLLSCFLVLLAPQLIINVGVFLTVGCGLQALPPVYVLYIYFILGRIWTIKQYFLCLSAMESL